MLKNKHFREEAWDHYTANLDDPELPAASYRRGNVALFFLSLVLLFGLVKLARSMPASALSGLSKKEPTTCVSGGATPASAVIQ